MSNLQASDRRVLSLAFNQDNSCLAIGTQDGFKIFNCDTCQCCYKRSEGAINVVEMLFSTSLVAVVGAGEQPALSPRRLSVFNTITDVLSAELNFVSSILCVRMNRKRLVVVLERKTYIHDLGQLTILHTIDTVSNSRALCALSPNHENCYLALPASTSNGTVLVFDALDLHAVCQIQAHRSPLAAMSFSSDGLLLATASDQGTVIRVHSIPQASKVHTFRRGSYPVTIYSLSFGPPSQVPQLLAASCASGTIHVFKLGSYSKPRTEDPLGNVGQTSHCAIAAHVEDSSEDGDEAPTSTSSSNRARIFVVTTGGFFHEWSITVGQGKESSCTLQREVAILSSSLSDEISAHFV
ncbi:autophagy-related protein 18b isoform X2 [Physcomitrium patens]|uniref:autophagy-related protein 18b isoform X2 n=1 Tax=Physcomitrium patens TaxID=3218 RepID=UPI000D171258|nr:autophagy-related protein 18b-like isoform X2 [Physcomitrium patens]|eukprot:XP_024379632.1 autophagy-related protein 18b-like isoform X2 [Physcomitrella patens]